MVQFVRVAEEASQATRTYPVTLVMAQPPDAEILPGMAGSAVVSSQLPETAKEAGKGIPGTAVFAGDDPEKSYVWVVNEADQTLSRREVELGQLSRYGVLLKAGVQAGEWIVIKGVHSLEDTRRGR